MVKIIGVRFRNVGKIYYFNPKSFQMKPGDHVIVETARGVEYGTVVLGPKEVDDRQVVQPLKDVIRMATQKDDAKEESNRKKRKKHIRSVSRNPCASAGDEADRCGIYL